MRQNKNSLNFITIGIAVATLTACGPGMKLSSEDLVKKSNVASTSIFKEDSIIKTESSSQSIPSKSSEEPTTRSPMDEPTTSPPTKPPMEEPTTPPPKTPPVDEPTTPPPPPPKPPAEKPKTTLLISSLNLCSNIYTMSVGTNVMKSTDGIIAEIRPYLAPGKDSPSGSNFPIKQDALINRTSLINSKSMSLDLTGLSPGSYMVQLKDKKTGIALSNTLTFDLKGDKVSNLKIAPFPSGGFPSIKKGNEAGLKMTVLYNTNNFQMPKRTSAGNGEGEPPAEPTEECDQRASPLMIDTESSIERSRFIMSAPLDGVKFDITGTGFANQISWPTQPARARFLVLPNAKGLVESVHELFGDNTRGPDGKGAANGFEALRKYDFNRDGIIDRFDAIYDDLRLWADLNRNGKVDSGELTDLRTKGITSIDLNYQEVQDVDAYGNQTRQRSTVLTDSGLLRMIVDIWFRPVF